MDKEQSLKHLIGLVYIGLTFAVIVLVIDYQMKQQILRESMQVRGNIKILDQAGRFIHDAARAGTDRLVSDVGTRDFASADDGSSMEAGSMDSVDGSQGEYAPD